MGPGWTIRRQCDRQIPYSLLPPPRAAPHCCRFVRHAPSQTLRIDADGQREWTAQSPLLPQSQSPSNDNRRLLPSIPRLALSQIERCGRIDTGCIGRQRTEPLYRDREYAYTRAPTSTQRSRRESTCAAAVSMTLSSAYKDTTDTFFYTAPSPRNPALAADTPMPPRVLHMACLSFDAGISRLALPAAAFELHRGRGSRYTVCAPSTRTNVD